MSDTIREYLAPFLDLVEFPAARWELLTAAEEYGADLRTRTALRTLSCGSYAHRQAVERELAQNAASRPAVSQDARPPRVRRRPAPAA